MANFYLQTLTANTLRPRFEDEDDDEYEYEPLTANPEKRLEFAELRQGLPGVDQLGR
jgi:hypothetical protein